ncbi:MAG: hypothetical protein CR988_01420 [Treponema sp.]|nr:MAG: hypothetical protein CR988_01420 [Treponema sp.]
MKNMGKFILFALFVLQAFSVFAQERNGTVSGDYVIYKDNSFVSDTWVGFLYYDENTYGAVLYTPADKRRVAILFSVEVKNGKLETTGQNIISDIDQRNLQDIEAVNYLMRLLPDMYSWSTDPKNFTQNAENNTIVKINKKQFADIDYFNGAVDIKYASYIPVFCIDSISSADGKNFLEIERIGRVGQNTDPEFFNFLIPFPKKQESKFNPAENGENKTIQFGDVKLALNNRWKPVADNYFLLDNTAVLAFVDIPLSAVTSELDNAPLSSLVKRLCLSGKDRTVMLSQMLLTGNETRFTLTNEVYDKKTQTVNIDIKTLIKNENSYTMISLTVNKADYETHKDYFNKLY